MSKSIFHVKAKTFEVSSLGAELVYSMIQLDRSTSFMSSFMN